SVVDDDDIVVVDGWDVLDDRVHEIDDVTGFIISGDDHADLGHLAAPFSSAWNTRPPGSALRPPSRNPSTMRHSGRSAIRRRRGQSTHRSNTLFLGKLMPASGERAAFRRQMVLET